MYEIRVGNFNDLEKIVKLNTKIFKVLFTDQLYSLIDYKKRIAEKKVSIYLVRNKDIIVGNSISYKRGGKWYIWILAIEKKYRNNGLASRLLKLNKDLAIKNNCNTILVKVYNISKEMLRLLIANGYEIVKVENKYQDRRYNKIYLELKIN